MLLHGAKYGADGFNHQIEDWLLKNNDSLRNQLAEEIVNCSSVTIEVARKWRMHNYLWCGFDLYILKFQSNFGL